MQVPDEMNIGEGILNNNSQERELNAAYYKWIRRQQELTVFPKNFNAQMAVMRHKL